jgi:hypothetical protein
MSLKNDVIVCLYKRAIIIISSLHFNINLVRVRVCKLLVYHVISEFELVHKSVGSSAERQTCHVDIIYCSIGPEFAHIRLASLSLSVLYGQRLGETVLVLDICRWRRNYFPNKLFHPAEISIKSKEGGGRKCVNQMVEKRKGVRYSIGRQAMIKVNGGKNIK